MDKDHRPKSARHLTSSSGSKTSSITSPREEKDKDHVRKVKSSHKDKDKSDKKSGSKTSRRDKESFVSVELTPENQVVVDELANYAWNNQLEEFKALLPKLVEQKIINGLNCNGQSALYCAARNGHSKILIELLNQPSGTVDVNVKAVPHGGTPLHAAGTNGKIDAIALLLACGADKEITNSAKQNATEGISPAVKEVYDAFSEGLIVKNCESLISDYPVLKDLSYVQAVLQRVELMKKKTLAKQQEQERALQEAVAKQEAEEFAMQPGFQLGVKKNVEKVVVDYSKLSAKEQEEHIVNLALSKSSYSFVNDTSDITSFLNYCNNPALAAQSIKNTADLAEGRIDESAPEGVDKELLNRIDRLLFAGVTDEIQKTKDSQFSHAGVIESLGFNPLFFDSSANYIVEDEGKTAKTANILQTKSY